MFATKGGTVEGLTPRQQQVLEFIRESVRANGYPPTVREICAALNLSSPSTVHAHLANLERLGLIKRDPTKPRALDVVQDLRPRRPLPLVGRVAAGQPILAEENIEELIDVPAFLRRDDDDFVLRVQGDSMADAGIFNGDFIVVHSQDQAQNGEIVVALVGDEATTKRFYNEGRTVRLQPENELYEPIIVNADEVELVGVDDDRLVELVLGLQAHGAALVVEALGGGLVADQRHDDLAVLRLILRVHDDEVAVEDAGAGHGVALHAEDEVVVVTAQEAGDVDELLDVLLGEDGHAGGDTTDQRQRARRSESANDVQCARLGGIALDEPQALEIGEVRVYGRWRGQVELRADLAHRRRIAVDAHAFADELEYLLLPPCETFHRSSSCGEHVFVCSLG